jgi:APA family basic amino acid/polyamine antiporter
VAIVALTAVNHVGLRAGALVQNLLTVAKVACLLGFVALGLFAEPTAAVTAATAASPGLPAGALAAFGLAMISALWAYDGWYVLCFSAGEVRRPERNLPAALILGTTGILVLYTAVNAVYLKAVPVAEMASAPRVAEAAATALFGPTAARAVAGVVLLTIFGCLASNILTCSRIYLPMAEDGLFFRSAAAVHPRYRTPVVSLWAQGTWASILALTGTYGQLYTYAVFVSLVLQAATAAAVFVLRRKRPNLPRPYRTWGYPVVPVLFILSCLLLIANTLMERPKESLLGLAFLALGVPAFAWLRQR